MRNRLLLILLCICSMAMSAAEMTVRIISTTDVMVSGAPQDAVEVHYQQSSRQKGHLTAGNTAQLRIYGMQGWQVHSIVLYMRSNTSAGAGRVSIMNGRMPLTSIPEGRFNQSQWNGAYSTAFVPIEIPVHKRIASTLSICITASANSLYIDSYKIRYARPPYGLTRHDTAVDPQDPEWPKDTTGNIVPTDSTPGDVPPTTATYLPMTKEYHSGSYYVVAEKRSRLLPAAIRSDSIRSLPATLRYDADSTAWLLLPSDNSSAMQIRFTQTTAEIYCPATQKYICYPTSVSSGKLTVSATASEWHYRILPDQRIVVYHQYDGGTYRYLCVATDNYDISLFRFSAKRTTVDEDGLPTDKTTHLLLFSEPETK